MLIIQLQFLTVLNLLNVPVLSQTAESDDSTVIDIRLPFVKVPAVETYYVCQQFKIVDDQPYHVTRFEPVINNTGIIHHMLLFGCEFELDDKGPHPCDSLDYRCRTWLVKWDKGMAEDIIMPESGGVRIGKGSFKYILLQIHWNNEGANDYQTDSSGMRLHVTTNLRQYDIGNVQIGQNLIEIPRDTDNVLISGICPSRCTALMLPKPIYITDVYLHMHSLGTKAAVDVNRDREITERLVQEDGYNYTEPIWHRLDPPAVIYPGEPIEIKCWYDSSNGEMLRNYTTYFGQGSSAEMCYGFIRYYPRILGFDQCIQNGSKTLNCWKAVFYIKKGYQDENVNLSSQQYREPGQTVRMCRLGWFYTGGTALLICGTSTVRVKLI